MTSAPLRLAHAIALLFLPAAAGAQQLEPPTHWRVAVDAPARAAQTDAPVDSAYWFVRMPPGYHVTMGPGAVLWDPRYFVEGRFAVEGAFFIFPNTGDGEYGVFVGGRELGTPQAAWTAFVVRRDGRAAVLRHEGGTTRPLVPWTAAPVAKPAVADDTPENVVRVEVDTTVTMRVNGVVVATLPADAAQLDGAAGFRIGRLVNLHSHRFDLLHRVAPPRPPAAHRP